jgi:hypothetical protein
LIPDYVERRLRQTPGDGSWFVPGSTPVVAFGNPEEARVATLGLNPSRKEFLDAHGEELDGERRRFETLASLGVSSLASASNEAISAVFRACNEYFRRNPYRTWFDPLDEVLRAIGASYYDGSACHLDLVQWATDPTWNGLSAVVRRRLLGEDSRFFLEQLRREEIGLLLLNGSGVIRGVQRSIGRLLPEKSVPITVRTVTTRFVTGSIEGVKVVGWSTNLQSSFGVTKQLRAKIAERVSELAGPS